METIINNNPTSESESNNENPGRINRYRHRLARLAPFFDASLITLAVILCFGLLMYINHWSAYILGFGLMVFGLYHFAMPMFQFDVRHWREPLGWRSLGETTILASFVAVLLAGGAFGHFWQGIGMPKPKTITVATVLDATGIMPNPRRLAVEGNYHNITFNDQRDYLARRFREVMIEHGSTIVEAANRHGVPIEQVVARIFTESSGRMKARSHAGAVCLMQLTGSLKPANPNDPVQCINAGTSEMARLSEVHGSTWSAPHYNASPEANQRAKHVAKLVAGNVPFDYGAHFFLLTETHGFVERNEALAIAFREWAKSGGINGGVIPTIEQRYADHTWWTRFRDALFEPAEAEFDIAPTAIMAFIHHKVKKGETASAIARKHGVKLDTLREANGGDDLSRIIAGQTLLVPTAGGKS